MSSLAALFRRRAMTLGCVFVFLRRGGMRLNDVGVFVHGNTPCLTDRRSGITSEPGTSVTVCEPPPPRPFDCCPVREVGYERQSHLRFDIVRNLSVFNFWLGPEK